MNEKEVISVLPVVNPPNGAVTSSGYYRSKLFSVHDSLSPFVSAAGPIFSLLDRLGVAKALPPIEKALANIDHELKAYYSQLQCQAYPQAQSTIAYYFVCVTIDELLARAYLRFYQRPPAFQAFTPVFYGDEVPGKKFFSLLTYLEQHPAEQLPLLELGYYCLMAGFEGEHHGKPDGRQILEAKIDELFRLIQPYRQSVSLNLFDKAKVVENLPTPYKRYIMVGLTLALLLVLFFDLSRVFLDYSAKKIRFAPAFMIAMDE